MLPEYDFSKLKGGVRGKYAHRYRQGSNVVLLAPDVAKVFPDAESVNAALRFLIQVATKVRRKGAR
jgi:hypothetical protein